MRKTLLILLLFLSSYKLFSQQDPVLRNFKFRNVNYRALTFNVTGGGQYNNTDYAIGKSTGHSEGGSTGVSYYTLKSTDKILLTASCSGYFSASHEKNTFAPGNSKYSSYYFTPYLSANNKWFIKKYFVELGTDINSGISSGKNIFPNPSNISKDKLHTYSLSATAGIGKGRLENITDMQNALWLNQALEKEGQLSHALSAEELNDLGKTIIVANNTRVLDARKKTRFILEIVDNYLEQKGLINKADIKYFSNLNDILFFAINYPRLSGTETYIRFSPSLNHLNGDHTQTSPPAEGQDNDITRSASLAIGLNRYIPFNLRHQNNYGLSLVLKSISYHQTNRSFSGGILTNQFEIKTDIKQAAINLFFQHAIYPNTRTVINFEFQTEDGYEQVKNSDSGFYGQADLWVTFNYFISYRTRFTCEIGTNWRKNLYSYDYFQYSILPDNIRLYASAGLQVNL